MYEEKESKDLSSLTPQLKGLEGWRVEVIDREGNRRRFIVGRSMGHTPIHLEMKTRRSLGGDAAECKYEKVEALHRVWKT